MTKLSHAHVVQTLLNVTRAAFMAMDNGEERHGGGVRLDRRYARELDKALDGLDELPDDQPGYIMEGPARAEWALRDLFAPIDMVLHCPECFMQHIDAPEEGVRFLQSASGQSSTDEISTVGGWSNPPHRSHLCHGCGTIWRPADVPTNGVAAITTRGKADNWPTAAEPWTRDNERTSLLLGLIDIKPVPDAVIAAWTDEQCQQADDYAGACHLNASDNDDVVVPPQPEHLKPYEWQPNEGAHRYSVDLDAPREPQTLDLANPATCAGCGCTDREGCAGGCYWLDVDRNRKSGVCSHCPTALAAWRNQRARRALSGQEGSDA